MTEVAPLLELPVGASLAVPAGPVPARVLETSYFYQAVAPSIASYVTQVSRWTATESERDVQIAQDGIVSMGAPTPLRTRQGSYTYDTFGNTTSAIVTTLGGVTTKQTSTYLNQASAWLIGLPDRVTETSYDTSGSPAESRVVDNDYDLLGRLWQSTREPDYPSSSLWQRAVLERTPRGLIHQQTVTEATGQAPRVMINYYDSEGVFVGQTKNPEGHYETAIYDPALGVALVTIDANGAISSAKYDGLGRPREALSATGFASTTSYAAYQPSAGENAGLIITEIGNDGGVVETTTDELGRTILDGHTTFDGAFSVRAISYSLFGTTTTVTRPGLGAPSAAQTTMTYDGLGRMLRIEEPDGATTHIEPSAFETKTWDPDGRLTIERRDLDGRVASTSSFEDLAATQEIETSYAYGPFGQLATITDPSQNVTTIRYDKLGRRTYLLDPDLGASSYTFSGFDEMATRTDALATTIYSRDRLGRVLTADDPEGQRVFVWDQAPFGLGALASSESPDDVILSYAYDTLGRLVGASTTLDASLPNAETFTTNVSYDPLGRIEQTLYPVVPGRARFSTTREYNPFGYLKSVSDASDPSTPTTLWHVDTREVDGSLSHATYGIGQEALENDLQYDPSTGRLDTTDLRASGASAALHQVSYNYYASGNVSLRSDGVTHRNEAFEYDGSGRLTRWLLSSSASAFADRDTNYAYDSLGNLTGTTVNGAATDQATFGAGGKPHALSTLNGLPYQVDARGRQYDGPERTIGFTLFDLPKSLTTKGGISGTTIYDYDASHGRVRKTAPAETTVYVSGLYERRQAQTGATHVFFIQAGDGAPIEVAYDEATQEEKRLVLAEDMLGSMQGAVDLATHDVERRFFAPFGRRVREDGSDAGPLSSDVHDGFTGHEEDAESGLVNMQGRMYDPAQRRFVTPDPLVTHPYFGQSLNRYSYVLNNPLRHTDPSGFQLMNMFPPPFSLLVCDAPLQQTEDVRIDMECFEAPAGDNPKTSQSTDGAGATAPSGAAAPAPGEETKGSAAASDQASAAYRDPNMAPRRVISQHSAAVSATATPFQHQMAAGSKGVAVGLVPFGSLFIGPDKGSTPEEEAAFGMGLWLGTAGGLFLSAGASTPGSLPVVARVPAGAISVAGVMNMEVSVAVAAMQAAAATNALVAGVVSWMSGGNTAMGTTQRVTNPKHHPNSNSPEPNNVDALFDASITDSSGRRWAKDADGVIHRFSAPNNGQTHWNGSTGGIDPIRREDIPIAIRRALQ